MTTSLTAILTRPAFNDACASLSQEDADTIAQTFPQMFRDAMTFGPFNLGTVAPPRPSPVKAREPKASSGPAIDKAVVADRLWNYVTANSGKRGEEAVSFVYNSMADRGDFKAFSRIARDVLEKFVTDGKMYADGERRGRRYKIVAPKQEEGAAE
jgi:hypothetical protein